ncbi:hypothetical protein [Streptomyces sp. NPDC055186]
MREDRRWKKAGGLVAGGRVAVAPEVRSQGVGEPGVDVAPDVPAGPPGQFVAHGFVPVAGLCLLQRAELAQRLEFVGTGGDPLLLAYGGLAIGGGRSFGGELRLDNVVCIRGVDGARRDGGEQLGEALPLRELRPAADVVGQVLEPGVPEGCRAGAVVGADGMQDAAEDPGGARLR